MIVLSWLLPSPRAAYRRFLAFFVVMSVTTLATGDLGGAGETASGALLLVLGWFLHEQDECQRRRAA